MSLFPEEDIITKEIRVWSGSIEKLPTDEDKVVFTKLLNDCYKYSVAMNNHIQTNPFPTESLIMALLLTQHKLINHLKSIIP
jgi:mannitol-specific phosphotransferase system IIBC component